MSINLILHTTSVVFVISYLVTTFKKGPYLARAYLASLVASINLFIYATERSSVVLLGIVVWSFLAVVNIVLDYYKHVED